MEELYLLRPFPPRGFQIFIVRILLPHFNEQNEFLFQLNTYKLWTEKKIPLKRVQKQKDHDKKNISTNIWTTF